MKLDLVDVEGNHLVSEVEKDMSEMHYLRFECYRDSYDMNTSVILKVIKDRLAEIFKAKRELEFDSWTLVDLDLALKGNEGMPKYQD